MQKSNLLVSTLVSVGLTLGLASCGGGDDEITYTVEQPTLLERMVPIYAPSAGALPIPNDILFSGSQDLTLNFPVEDPMNYSDPLVAVSALDGWSAVAPIVIDFENHGSGLSLNAGSVPAGVHVFKVNTFRPEVAPGIPAPTGPVTGVIRELVPAHEYIATAVGSTTVAILPTVPFEQQGAYMVVLTDSLTDSAGNALTWDVQYGFAKGRNPIPSDSSIAALEPIRQLVNAMEDAAASEGIPHGSIVQSFQFTVQSVGAVMETAKAAYIDYPFSLGAPPATSFSSLMTDTAPFTTIGAADLYKGSIALTYMLGVPSGDNPTAPLNTFWKALEQLPIGPGGALVPNPFGENLTYANNVPRINAQETAPLLVSMPKAALCPKPATGYPVAIFQHGITGDRTNMLGIADAMAAPPSCTAVVAMDQPIHGIDANNPVHLGLQAASGGFIGIFEGYTPGGLRERTFGIDYLDNTTGAPGPDGNPDSSGSHTINLANLLVSRDNLRQATFDLLTLEKAIPAMDVDGGGPDFDSTRISFIGHSLGGIVGTNFIAYSDFVQAAALANPGGAIAQLLNNSDAFGPRIRAGVAAAAGMDVSDPAFGPVLDQFLLATQTVVDSGDPINTAAHALTNNVPTLMLQVAGDTVVPNAALTAPTAGTEPLARALELTTVATDDPGLVPGARQFTKLNMGLHSTVLSPDDGMGNAIGLLNVTTEMQTQIVSFLASGGAALQVVDPSLLDD